MRKIVTVGFVLWWWTGTKELKIQSSWKQILADKEIITVHQNFQIEQTSHNYKMFWKRCRYTLPWEKLLNNSRLVPRHISENIDIALEIDFGRSGAIILPYVYGGQRSSCVSRLCFSTMLLYVLGPQA